VTLKDVIKRVLNSFVLHLKTNQTKLTSKEQPLAIAFVSVAKSPTPNGQNHETAWSEQ